MEQKDILNLISNEQRKYFGLEQIDQNWKSIDVESPNFQGFGVTIFVDGQTVKKCIIYGEKKYKEFKLDETLSKNFDLILPKIENKKPSTLDSIVNKSAVGVTLSFDAPIITIYNELSNKTYYKNYFDKNNQTNTIEEFKNWVENWCNSSTEDDLKEVEEFSKQTSKQIVSYNEGDVFKVKLSRREYGYGRILLDYNKMRENNESFWDCLMGTPIIISLYHILTDDKNVSVESLKNLKSFPSEIVMDSGMRNGDYEIIGNIPVDYSKENYPIMYGNSLDERDVVYLQQGKTFLKLDNATPISRNFRNNGVSYNLGIDTNLMKECIAEKSNLPYFEKGPYSTRTDLRNPINTNFLEQIFAQFNI